MDENYERFINTLICNFDNFYKAKTGAWFLDKETLLEFVCNKRFIQPVHIGMVNCTREAFTQRMSRNKIEDKGNNQFKVTLQGYPVNIKLYNDLDKNIIVAPPDKKEILMKKKLSAMRNTGVWRYNLDGTHWYHFPIPYKVGEYLDNTMPLWFKNFRHKNSISYSNDVFFTKTRTKNALELMALLKECAEKAGFGQYIFPAFGTLLGIAREGGFVGSDRDLDHAIAGWKITKEQEERFLIEVARERTIMDENDNPIKYPQGLYTGRKRSPQRRNDTGRFLWTSLGHKKPHGQKGCKSCVWKFFTYNNFAWHSKGRKWVSDRKFNMDAFNYTGEIKAIAKGMPANFLDEFVEMDFQGIKINVPRLTGHCLDMWYPGWARPRKEKSSKKYVLIVPRWEDEKKWKMV